MKTPVALIIFRRPETTERVFAAVAAARPPKLLVVANSPRPGLPEEVELCRRTRAVLERVDWDCEVLTHYAPRYREVRDQISDGLDWVFDTVEEAIILEDDCVPHPSFFPYCDEMLARYRADERVMMVSGDNFQFGRRRTPDSYYFSRYTHIWGWASWRRAWRNYDVGLGSWARLRETRWLEDLFGDERAARYWRHVFDEVAAGRIDTWDYQWAFAVWSRGGLCATPDVNLVTNIGWGAGSTHTGSALSPLANLPVAEMRFPLRHPARVEPQREADRFTFERLFVWDGYEPTLYRRLHRKFFGALPPGLRRSLSGLRARLA